MEKRKQGRPKVDSHITDGQFNNRRQELNYKYMFEGTGVLMDAADEIPKRTILYEIDDSNLRFKACKNGILEQLGHMRVQDNVSLDDCIYAIDAIKAGVGVKEITVAIRKVRSALKKYKTDVENEDLEMDFYKAVYLLKKLGDN